MTEIKLESVDKIYDPGGDAIHAVEDLDITIREGEFMVFVGPSGCGKTTTLRMIAGLETVSSGRITFDGEDVTEARPRDRGVAMVFQDYALYPHMTVRKNIGFGLRLSTNMPEAEIAERVEETAEMLGIADQLDQHPPELSGGQQQRVALGRAIIRDPTVFLLDEPLSNLDAKLRDDMRKEIMRLQQRLGVTSVYVTHDQTEAMALGDRVAVMNEGRLQQVGPPEEVYYDPVNKFVAGFLGSPSMNFVQVTVEAVADGSTYLDGPGDFAVHDLPETMATTVGEYGRLTVGLRPEDLAVVESGGVAAEVGVTEAMGDENVVYVHVGDTELIVRTETYTRLSPGNQAHIGFDVADVYLFDPDIGKALKTKAAQLSDEPGRQLADAPDTR